MSTKSFGEFIDPSRKDIWRYSKFLGKTKEGRLLNTQQFDFTPIETLKIVGQRGMLLEVKREDNSITGSHKFRSLTYQLNYLLSSGVKKAVLSSSGNAAISTSQLLPKDGNLKLFTFLSKKTSPEKLAAIQHSPNFIPILSSRPLRLAKYAIKHFKLRDLRPSQDANAIIGFRSLGFEIFEQKPQVKNIFSFATSFASILGIQEAYEILMKLGCIEKPPKLFAVVSSGQLAGILVADKKLCRTSNRQKCLSDKHVCCANKNIRIVNISDKEISSTQQKYPQLETSYEGIASLAAAEKMKPKGETLVILTGKVWEKKKPDLDKFLEAENFTEVDKIVTLHK